MSNARSTKSKPTSTSTRRRRPNPDPWQKAFDEELICLEENQRERTGKLVRGASL